MASTFKPRPSPTRAAGPLPPDQETSASSANGSSSSPAGSRICIILGGRNFYPCGRRVDAPSTSPRHRRSGWAGPPRSRSRPTGGSGLRGRRRGRAASRGRPTADAVGSATVRRAVAEAHEVRPPRGPAPQGDERLPRTRRAARSSRHACRRGVPYRGRARRPSPQGDGGRRTSPSPAPERSRGRSAETVETSEIDCKILRLLAGRRRWPAASGRRTIRGRSTEATFVQLRARLDSQPWAWPESWKPGWAGRSPQRWPTNTRRSRRSPIIWPASRPSHEGRGRRRARAMSRRSPSSGSAVASRGARGPAGVLGATRPTASTRRRARSRKAVGLVGER